MNPFPRSSTAARVFEEIAAVLPRLPLVAGSPPPVPGLDEAIRLPGESLLGAPVRDPAAAMAVRAGLLLRADRMEDSHAICQELETPEGRYWHAILHRREPDPGNARYWFRLLGHHPVFESLSLPESGGSRKAAWDPLRFMDFCEACEGDPGAGMREEAEELQATEITRLLAHCIGLALEPGTGSSAAR